MPIHINLPVKTTTPRRVQRLIAAFALHGSDAKASFAEDINEQNKPWPRSLIMEFPEAKDMER
ncbi:MAG: hypothetical protein ACREBD_31990 [Blastocatellia bacterium]